MAGGQAGVPLQAVGAEEPLPVSPWGWQCSAQPAALLGRLALLWGQEAGAHFSQTGLDRGSLARCASPVCISMSSLLSWLASSVFENKLLFVLL